MAPVYGYSRLAACPGAAAVAQGGRQQAAAGNLGEPSSSLLPVVALSLLSRPTRSPGLLSAPALLKDACNWGLRQAGPKAVASLAALLKLESQLHDRSCRLASCCSKWVCSRCAQCCAASTPPWPSNTPK
jgi:hypothetical protein